MLLLSEFDTVSITAMYFVVCNILGQDIRPCGFPHNMLYLFKIYCMCLFFSYLQKTHIHAFAGLDFVNEMDDVPEERKVYNISEFNVDDAKYSYVAVSNKSEIYFLKRTNMTLIEEEDDMIPKYKFELVSLNALKLKVGNTKILTGIEVHIYKLLYH